MRTWIIRGSGGVVIARLPSLDVAKTIAADMLRYQLDDDDAQRRCRVALEPRDDGSWSVFQNGRHELTVHSMLRTDTERMDWLDVSDLENVRGRMNNEDVSVREAIDWFMDRESK